jgi:ABC-2 type transport system permease protein
MVWLRTAALIFRTHLARMLWSKRTLLCVLLAMFPVVPAFLVARFGRDVGPGEIAVVIGFLLHLQVVVPLLALIAGSAAVAEEVEDRTITFLFSRPIPRSSVLIGRWLAILVFLTSLLGVATWLLLHVSAQSRNASPPLDVDIALPLYVAVFAGGLVYSAVFATFGVFFKSPVIVGLGYVFAIEGFLANLPAGTQVLSVQYHLRSLIAALGSATWNQAEGFSSTKFESLGHASTVLAVVAVSLLGFASGRIRRKEFVQNA